MSHISNLGQVATLLQQFADGCAQDYEDANAFHAPSECNVLIARGHSKVARRLRRRIHALTRQSSGAVMRELTRRVSGKWLYYSGIGSAAQDVFYGGFK